jgi:hypothetical protein
VAETPQHANTYNEGKETEHTKNKKQTLSLFK